MVTGPVQEEKSGVASLCKLCGWKFEFTLDFERYVSRETGGLF
jgi:hypothetical protein